MNHLDVVCKQIGGYDCCFIEWNLHNEAFLREIILQWFPAVFIHNNYHRDIFKDFANKLFICRNFQYLFNQLNRFCYTKNIEVKINFHTRDKNASRKITSKIFQFVLSEFLNKKFNINSVVSNGIQHDIIVGNFKIDAKTKHGKQQFCSKNYQIDVAYNSQNNNNNSDFYVWGIYSTFYLQYNILNYFIPGIITKENFFQIAKVRVPGDVITNRFGKPTYKDGKLMIAERKDYYSYVQYLKKIQYSVFNNQQRQISKNNINSIKIQNNEKIIQMALF